MQEGELYNLQWQRVWMEFSWRTVPKIYKCSHNGTQAVPIVKFGHKLLMFANSFDHNSAYTNGGQVTAKANRTPSKLGPDQSCPFA